MFYHSDRKRRDAGRNGRSDAPAVEFVLETFYCTMGWDKAVSSAVSTDPCDL